MPADLILVHVDLSVVPEKYLAFASRYSIVLNGRLPDIRKSVVSTNLVGMRDSWTGPVIAKSDLNYGGRPERSRRPRWRDKYLRVWHAARRAATRLTGQEERTDLTKDPSSIASTTSRRISSRGPTSWWSDFSRSGRTICSICAFARCWATA